MFGPLGGFEQWRSAVVATFVASRVATPPTGSPLGRLPRGIAPTDLNLLLITLDTTRADRLGAYGATAKATLPTVIAPDSLMPLDWIIDYEEANHQTLFAMGKADAVRALAKR